MLWIALGLVISLVTLLGAGAYTLVQILGEFSQS